MPDQATLYGISNCDSVKKARKWLENQQIPYQFHDFRKDGIEREQVTDWVARLGWETLINKRSTTWKTLDDDTRNALDADSAVDLVLQHPTLVKRPLLSRGDLLRVGFKADDYATLLTS